MMGQVPTIASPHRSAIHSSARQCGDTLSDSRWDKTMSTRKIALFLSLFCMLACSIAGADDDADLAKKLANPIAALISLPIQLNYDSNFGIDDDGSVLRINVQPVIPVSVGDDWNMIS